MCQAYDQQVAKDDKTHMRAALNILNPVLGQSMDQLCRNMSGHALMGRPAARLETVVLVKRSYVVVCIVDKMR